MASKYGFEPPAPPSQNSPRAIIRELFIDWEKSIHDIEPIVKDVLEDFGKSQLIDSIRVELSRLCTEVDGWGPCYNEARWELYYEGNSKVSILFRQILLEKKRWFGKHWRLEASLIGKDRVKKEAMYSLQQVLSRELSRVSNGRMFAEALLTCEVKCF